VTLRRSTALPLALLMVLLPGPGSEAGRKDPYLEGDRLEFAFDDLDGRPVRSSDPRFEGRVLLVDLWGTWCAPCISEIPTLVDLQERLGDRGLVIVAIAFEDEEEDPEARRANLREFAAQRGINYLVLDGRAPRDSDEALPGLQNVRGFPVEILVGRDGRVVDIRNGYGYKKRWARKLERELTELLRPPAP
jgi:thiol-disulfide isomerase/thioredoxin